MIEVEGLSKNFGSFKALCDVTFKVDQGQIVGFLGPNGAGKTTTMDIICGCMGADAGLAKLGGCEISENPKEVKRMLGYLPEAPPIYDDMRVLEYIKYAAKLKGVDSTKSKKSINELMERLSLDEVRYRLIANLSKGYRQRVGLAGALVHDPKVLVLDEPTDGLDPNQIAQIRELIRSLKHKHTIIFSSHILSEVENICDEVIIIDKGKIIEQGTYDELIARNAFRKSYHLKVGTNPEKCCAELRELINVIGVQLISEKQNLIEFTIDEDQGVIDNVAKKVIDRGYGLKEIILKSKSLEDIFLKLTKANNDL